MTIFIDRRLTDRNKSLSSRRKYLDRIKDQLKDSVRDSIRSSTVKDLLSSKQKNVTIPGKGLSKPKFNYKTGGITDEVYSGNEKFEKGDKFLRPSGEGEGEGGAAGLGEDGEDPFTFTLTREEFLDLFFQDLELPDMIKHKLAEVREDTPQRAGFSVDGTPNRLNIVRSLKQSKGRRFALTAPFKKKLEEYQKELDVLLQLRKPTDDELKRITFLNEEIELLKAKIIAIPFFDDIDLRYNRWEIKPKPITQAVMFLVLDVSGSMGEWEKEMAKRFFLFEALFLHANYERLQIEWIIHTTEAHRVDEETFFHSRLTGGTVVSPALRMVRDIIDEEYSPSEWNIFISQISDGDNYLQDNPLVMDVMTEKILPITQYYTYCEIRRDSTLSTMMGNSSTLYGAYSNIEGKYRNFKRSIITDVVDIWPTFRKLFEKKAQ